MDAPECLNRVCSFSPRISGSAIRSGSDQTVNFAARVSTGMAQSRDERGRFSEKVSEQDLLVAFDFVAESPDDWVTIGEVTEALAEHRDVSVSRETVRQRLQQMCEDGTVSRKQFGSSAVGWAAAVAPQLDADVAADSDERREATDDEYVALDDI